MEETNLFLYFKTEERWNGFIDFQPNQLIK